MAAITNAVESFKINSDSPEFKTIAFFENNKRCQEILELRWPGVPVYGDIRELLNEETMAHSKNARADRRDGEQGNGGGYGSRGDAHGQ